MPIPVATMLRTASTEMSGVTLGTYDVQLPK